MRKKPLRDLSKLKPNNKVEAVTDGLKPSFGYESEKESENPTKHEIKETKVKLDP